MQINFKYIVLDKQGRGVKTHKRMNSRNPTKKLNEATKAFSGDPHQQNESCWKQVGRMENKAKGLGHLVKNSGKFSEYIGGTMGEVLRH